MGDFSYDCSPWKELVEEAKYIRNVKTIQCRGRFFRITYHTGYFAASKIEGIECLESSGVGVSGL